MGKRYTGEGSPQSSQAARTRRSRLTCLAAPAIAAFATLALAAPPSAAATTDTFIFTGGAQTWTVPDGVGEATFDVFGAEGASGNGGAEFGPGGLGGRATVTVAVSPGQTFQINVGGAGSGATGGFNGGANSGVFIDVAAGGGGGGAADVRSGSFGLDDRVVVAGGGGGGGNSQDGITRQPSSGGNGGGASGGDGIGVGLFPEPGTGELRPRAGSAAVRAGTACSAPAVPGRALAPHVAVAEVAAGGAEVAAFTEPVVVPDTVPRAPSFRPASVRATA